MAKVTDIITDIQKTMGKEVISIGVEYENVERIPTGIFEFDLPTGGGFPRGRISILWGGESSCKTTLALKAIASFQKSHPEMLCVFIDIENSYSTEWGTKMGVDNNKLVYVLPETAEDVVNIVQGLLSAEDVGIIVLDSLAAMITTNEAESNADKAVVGGSGLVVGKLYRKCTLGLSKARKAGRHPTVIAINQIRMKIGVMFGDPSTMPGGNAFKFASSLTVKLRGKNIKDAKVDGDLAVFKEIKGTIQKWKVPITSQNVEYMMATINSKEYGLKIGRVNDYKAVEKRLEAMGLLGKTDDGKGYFLFEETFKRKQDIKKYLKDNPDEYQAVKDHITEEVLKKTTIEYNEES